MIDRKEIEFTPQLKKKALDCAESMAGLGERVLGFCYLSLDDYPDDYHFDKDTMNFPVKGMCFVGLQSLIGSSCGFCVICAALIFLLSFVLLLSKNILGIKNIIQKTRQNELFPRR